MYARETALDMIREAVQDAGWHTEGSDRQLVELMARLVAPLAALSAEYTRIPQDVRDAILTDAHY